jgi:predicted HTH transcriptional regulator
MKNGNISVSKCAKELGIDIDTVLEILTRLEKSKSKNAISDSMSVFVEQEKDYSINTQANVSIPLEQEKDYSIADLIKSGESSTLEFKSSMLLPTQKDPTISLIESKITDTTSKEDREKFEKAIKEKEKALKEEIPFMIVKTIAAFLNSDGGILLVGVKDDGSIYGLENDFQAVSNNRKNLDGWLQYLVELINNQIGTEFIQYIKVKFLYSSLILFSGHWRF